jgi:L-seryl-tRNA(Ser) seleniumtransferase
MTNRTAALRSLPSVDQMLRHPQMLALLDRYSRGLVTDVVRERLDQIRADLGKGVIDRVPSDADLIAQVADRLRTSAEPSLQPVVNATGVVLHTNLGRAVLAPEAVQAMVSVAQCPSSLEYDLDGGGRGDRDTHVETQLCELTGAEAATAVNNNAAAVLLALNTLAEGREVIVSRGELIEIGGSFRIPEILAKSGAVLREVGTTNRTHAADYEKAINERTGLLLKVHPSNYRIAGFTAEVPLEALVELGRKHGLPVMEDLGSGALVDLQAYGLPHEPVVRERVQLGADVVTFSGDKLLGGPQAGLVVGRREIVDRVRRNPLKRALRCDKLTLAALDATLRLHRTSPDLAAALPTLRSLTRPIADLEVTGRQALGRIAQALGDDYQVELVDSQSEIGSGAQPTETLPSKAIVITHPSIGPLEIAARFRHNDPPILGRVHDDRFWLDLRCVEDPNDLVPKPAR